MQLHSRRQRKLRHCGLFRHHDNMFDDAIDFGCELLDQRRQISIDEKRAVLGVADHIGNVVNR